MTLRDYRLAAGLTQRQLASKIGVGVVMICEMEKGVRWIPPHRVAKIAKALGVSREEIEKLRRVCQHCGGTGRAPSNGSLQRDSVPTVPSRLQGSGESVRRRW